MRRHRLTPAVVFDPIHFMHTVLHLHWRPPQSGADEPVLLFWAETHAAPQPARQRGRPADQPHSKPHPFAVVDANELRSALQTFDSGLLTSGTETFTLQMPTTRTGPQPSPDLIHQWDLDRSEPRLSPWEIFSLRLPLASAARLLGILHSSPCPEHFTLGTDLNFWHSAFGLVIQVLAQQNYVPTLAPALGGGYRSRWQPVLDSDPGRDQMLVLTEAMPPLCRSELSFDGNEIHPYNLLHDFVCYMADHLIRTWGIEAPHRLGYLHSRTATTAWLRGLVLPNPNLDDSGSQVEALVASLRVWQRNLTPIGDAAFAIALRLLTPPKAVASDQYYVPEGGWRLEYLLQARDEPDLLVPAEQVWQTQAESLVFQQRRFDRPQEKLLEGLGRAAQIFPPIERSLQAPTPDGIDLTTTEVYRFLREAAPVLTDTGFSLVLPSWWEAAGASLGLRHYLTPLMPEPPDVVSNPASAERPIAYRWELVLGDNVLTRSAFAELVALRASLVQKDGQWLRLDPEQIEAATRFWDRASFEGRMDLRQALRTALGLDTKTDIAGLPVVQSVAEGWLADLIYTLTEGDDRLREADQPASLNGQLRPYQRYGFAWLHTHRHLGLGAILADDMGLGKSVQAIALLLQEKAELGGLPGPTLLVCPTSLLENWRREINRFAPQLRVFVHYGPNRPRRDTFSTVASAHDIVLSSYTLARRDAELLEAQSWYGLILDEAQKIKNPDIQVTRAINGFSAGFRLALTGTPIENQLTELWSIFNFLNRGYLGSENSFRKHYAFPIERFHDPVVTARLQRMVRPFVLRRLKSDPTVIQDLPERLEMKVYCTLTDEQAELYQTVVSEGLPRVRDLHGRARRLHIFNLLTRLKQVLNHPALYLVKKEHSAIDSRYVPDEPLLRRSGKLDRLTEMLYEVLAVGDHAVVFTQFAETGFLLASHLQQQFDRPVLYLHGGVPLRQRQEMIMGFQEDPHAPHIFVMTLKTGGLGLNLTTANHVFHYDRWWNPAVEDQASDRTYRIGQTRNVQIHKFITAGTLEEKIDEMIERKHNLADLIVSGDESWLADLSDDDLVEVLALPVERS